MVTKLAANRSRRVLPQLPVDNRSSHTHLHLGPALSTLMLN